MGFLAINGWEIPTELGGSAINTEFGNRQSAFDGSRRRSLIALKRDLEFKTVRAKEMTSEAYRGAILGLGLLFHFNGDTYATNGLYALAGSGEVYHHAAAGDGDPSYTCAYTGASWNNFVKEYYYGTGALGCYFETVNVLAADSRDAENAPAGYTSLNAATISANTTHFWQGTKSVKCVCDDVVESWFEGLWTDACDPGAGSANKTYTGSIYVKGDSGGEVVKTYMYDQTNTDTGPSRSYTLANANTWYRIKCEMTIGGSDCRALRLAVVENVDGSGITFYCDGWQIEQASVMTGWVDGTRASGTALFYAINGFGQDLTFNLWTFGPGYGTGTSQFGTVLDTAASPTEGIGVYAKYNSTDNFISFISFTGGSNYAVTANSVWNGAWKMCTLVLRRNPETGENEAEIYINGVSVKTGTFTDLTTNIFDRLVISYSTLNIQGILDDYMLVPYAATADQILAWYNMAKAMSDFPKVYITGDCIPEAERTVIGEIKGTKYESFQGDTALHLNATSHNFILREE